MTQILRLTGLLLLLALPAQAQDSPAMSRMAEALRLDEIIDIMRQEGISSADELARDMLGSAGGDFEVQRDRIYDAKRMRATVLAGMDEVLGSAEAAAISDFFETELGARIIGLELSAREAFMDEDIEEASNEIARGLADDNPGRLALLDRFIEVNNLLESNVVGALNSNFAFYSGLVDGGAFAEPPAEEDMLAEIWGQEPEIRENTGLWLHSYLNLSYQPLSDEELEAYIAFSETDAGQAMNRALFEGFDVMFEQISRALGLTLGRLSGAQEL